MACSLVVCGGGRGVRLPEDVAHYSLLEVGRTVSVDRLAR
jgi:hypothetical protein